MPAGDGLGDRGEGLPVAPVRRSMPRPVCWRGAAVAHSLMSAWPTSRSPVAGRDCQQHLCCRPVCGGYSSTPPPEVMIVDDFASYLHLSKSSFYKLAQDGRVPGQQVGRHWQFHKSAVDACFIAGDAGPRGRRGPTERCSRGRAMTSTANERRSAAVGTAIPEDVVPDGLPQSALPRNDHQTLFEERTCPV